MKRVRLATFIVMVASILLAGYLYYETVLTSNEDVPVVTAPEEVLTVSVEDDTSALLEGVTAVDPTDGDVSDTLVVESISTFTDDKRRIVTIAAFDKDKNVGKTERQIQYSDYEAPRFALSEPLILIQNSTDSYSDYFSATDTIDGNVTKNIRLSYDNYFDTYLVGSYQCQLEVSNSIGDVVTLPFTYDVYDQTTYNKMPKIALSEYLVYTQVGKALDADSYLEEISVVGQDVELSEVTVDTSGVDYNKAGTYEIVYSYTDDDNMTGLTRLIVVVE